MATEGNAQEPVPLSSDYYRTTPHPIHKILEGTDFQSQDEKAEGLEADAEKKQPVNASTGGSRARGSASSKLGTRDSAAFGKKKSISTLNNSQKQKFAALKQSIKPPTKKPAPAP